MSNLLCNLLATNHFLMLPDLIKHNTFNITLVSRTFVPNIAWHRVNICVVSLCFYCAFSSAFESIIHNLLLQAILWCSCDLIKRNTFNITFVSRMFVPSMTLSLSFILYHVILFMPICHDSVINPYFLVWIHQLYNLPLQNQICLCLVFTIFIYIV